MMTFIKKSKSDTLVNFLEKFNSEVKKIKKEIEETQNYRKCYSDVKKSFIFYIKKLFDIDKYVTEDEILEIMLRSNISSDTIHKSKKIMSFINEIDYSGNEFNTEDIYDFIEDCELIYEEIYSQRMGDLFSKEENLSKFKKNTLLKKFKTELDKLKSYYSRKHAIPTEHMLRVTEYYEKLDHKNKEQFSKDYHYYCINLYHILTLLKDITEVDKNDTEEIHLLIAKINKIFFKLDDKERKELYHQIIKVINSHEEKLNFYIFGGYEYIHKKNFDKATSLYSKMMEHYNELNENKKNFYNGIITRYLEHIENALKKNKQASQ